MTGQAKDVIGVLNEMDEPITAVNRAASALELIAMAPDMQPMDSDAIAFVVDGLRDLSAKLGDLHDKGLDLARSGDKRERQAPFVRVSGVGRAER